MKIALIAHDGKKADMVDFVLKRLLFFSGLKLDKHPHDVDIAMLMRLCDVHNIPLATNYNSACAVVEYLNSQIK